MTRQPSEVTYGATLCRAGKTYVFAVFYICINGYCFDSVYCFVSLFFMIDNKSDNSNLEKLILLIKKLPMQSGVYLFKDSDNQILYIGKAKNLKKRVANYITNYDTDLKSQTILSLSVTLEHIVTKTELEAMLLEAQLIQSHQPKCNILLKTGQPFLYIFISQGSPAQLKLVRTKKQKGTYFGPFLEKTSARSVFNFLIKTFRLQLCKQKIATGCLFYHLGICAGNCRPDFSLDAYNERLALAKESLSTDREKFIASLKERIENYNTLLEFEKSRELYWCVQAFEKVFDVLDTPQVNNQMLIKKDIWIVTPDCKALFLFGEHHGALTKRHVFYFPLNNLSCEIIFDYFESYYRITPPPSVILLNFDISQETNLLYQDFFTVLHKRSYSVSIEYPQQGHHAALVRMATIKATQELEKQATLSQALQRAFKLSKPPKTIDCFDISHKQGMFMVGACVRFTGGQPDKNNFRRFHIKSIDHQDDCAALAEIVIRRYKDPLDLPDLIVIDGGKGQLNAVKHLVPVDVISLAKREETVFSGTIPAGKKLDPKSYVGQLLISLRDYTHHVAISFHRAIAKN